MTESEILILQVELLGLGWSILQTWLGATFAIVLAAHFAARTLNIYLVVGMLLMYSIFAAAFLAQEINLIARLELLADDLMALENSNYSISASGLEFVNRIRNGMLPILYKASMFVGTIGACIYVIYCYRKSSMQSAE